jgi:hypothetical protein
MNIFESNIRKVFSENPWNYEYYISGSEGNGKYLKWDKDKFTKGSFTMEQGCLKDYYYHGEFKKWDYKTGELIRHCFFKKDKIIKDII